MEENNIQINNKKTFLSILGVAILVVGLVGITYAFFNYTRTGSANTIRTGEIYFNAEQGNTVTLSDLFPITVAQNETVTASTPGVGSLSLHITGNTTYEEGVEYLIEAVDVTSSGQSALPISIQIAYAPTEAVSQSDELYPVVFTVCTVCSGYVSVIAILDASKYANIVSSPSIVVSGAIYPTRISSPSVIDPVDSNL